MANFFAVVETVNAANEREVSVVPDIWISRENNLIKLHWPPGKDSSLKARKRMIPNVKWAKYSCTILRDKIGNLQ